MNNSNLSCSRRSISKSVNKVDELKLSVKNNNSSKNTPPLQNNNSSNKKHSQRNISMVTKL